MPFLIISVPSSDCLSVPRRSLVSGVSICLKTFWDRSQLKTCIESIRKPCPIHPRSSLGKNGYRMLEPWTYPLCRWFPQIGVPPKSSIFIGLSLKNHPFGGTPFSGNPHVGWYVTSIVMDVASWPRLLLAQRLEFQKGLAPVRNCVFMGALASSTVTGGVLIFFRRPTILFFAIRSS